MEKWEKTLLSPDDSIFEATKKIDESGLQIAMVVDNHRKLLGIITDGDVRRAIIRGVNFNSSVSCIMNTNPITVSPNESKQSIKAIMHKKIINHIPVIDEFNCVCGLMSATNLIYQEKKDNSVVIMAGGLGSRLWPMTKDCPKPLLKIGNKPILETIIGNFIEQGFSRFYLSVNYKSEMIESYFGDGAKFGADIYYLKEETRLGTAGALAYLPEQRDPTIVMNGDLLTKFCFADFISHHINTTSVATMAVREFTYTVPYGVVEFDGSKITAIHEKPENRYLVSGGIYLLNAEVISSLHRGEKYDMPDIFTELIRNNVKTSIFPIKDYWLDIGRIDDFKQAQSDYLNVFSSTN